MILLNARHVRMVLRMLALVVHQQVLQVPLLVDLCGRPLLRRTQTRVVVLLIVVQRLQRIALLLVHFHVSIGKVSIEADLVL